MLRTSRSFERGRMKRYWSTADMPTPGFNPLEFAPSLWLDSSFGMESGVGVPAGIGDDVVRWLDKSGNDKHAVSEYSDHGVATVAGLACSGLSVGYSTGAIISMPFTLFVVEKPNTSGDGSIRTVQSNTTNMLIAASRNDGFPAYAAGAVSSFYVSDMKSHICEWTAVSGSNITYFVDGVNKTTGSISSINWGEFGIGAFGTTHESPNTTIREIYIASLDSQQRTEMREYLANKYSIVLT